ncbi:MAG: hypothetical protein KJ811_05140 [Candidatus Margulisbacteria bacterium]|nr:hypothetical protein [Candidatus Margulisiibacteriota bacterium]
MLRGGSWNNNNADNLRCANRNNNHPGNSNDNNGFRVAEYLELSESIFSRRYRECEIKSKAYPFKNRPALVSKLFKGFEN